MPSQWNIRAHLGISSLAWPVAFLSVALLAGCPDGPRRGSSSGGNNGEGGDGSASSATSGAGGSSSVSGSVGSSGSGSGGSVSSTGAGGSAQAGEPPFGKSSGGNGGPAPVDGQTQQASGITYRLIVPGSPGSPSPLLVVYSGTEGGAQMTSNLTQLANFTGTGQFIFAVLDGVTYNGNGAAGATVLDDVRAKYDIDNDRTYLLGESAGTTAALKLGFSLRQSYFAAYWANDVNASDTPDLTAAQLGFEPWGQAGPGGAFAQATQIVDGMKAAGYRLPDPAPYDGPGAGTHGDPNQFIAALGFFVDKSRTGP